MHIVDLLEQIGAPRPERLQDPADGDCGFWRLSVVHGEQFHRFSDRRPGLSGRQHEDPTVGNLRRRRTVRRVGE